MSLQVQSCIVCDQCGKDHPVGKVIEEPINDLAEYPSGWERLTIKAGKYHFSADICSPECFRFWGIAKVEQLSHNHPGARGAK